ncbi:MAG: hypothetical protein ACREV1_11365 [Gammaproteobacteria bacterium]
MAFDIWQELTRLLGAEAVFTGDLDRTSVDRCIRALREELRHKAAPLSHPRAAAPMPSAPWGMRWRSRRRS